MSENKCETKYPFERAACYIANRYTNLEDWQEAQREATKRFMNGNLSGQDMEDIKRTIKKVLAKYNKPGDEWVITFIPASTNKRYEKRYEPLKIYLREEFDIPVAYFGICIYEESQGRERDIIVTGNLYRRKNLLKVKNKKVILIDDVVTTGRTLRTVGDFIMNEGAKAVYGVIYAMTIHPDLPEKET